MGTIQIDGSTPKLTIGNATAEDATILFDGNAQDFYIALDDSADDLLIGLGSTVGTTPAIAIDENLKVNIPVTTASTSASTGSLTTGGGAGIGADLYVGDDVYLITDSAVLGFGADKDTTLTHTDGTGLTLNSTNKLCFNDATQYIQGASGTVLDIAATDEIELTSTLVDLNGNLDVSGTTLLPTLGVVSAKDLGVGVHIRVSDTGGDAHADADALVIEDNAHMGITLLTSASTESTINFGDANANRQGRIAYDHSNDIFNFYTSQSNNAMKIDANGIVMKPLQPAFSAKSASLANQTGGGTEFIVSTWNSERFDLNGDFASDTFTAPVTGKYFFTFSLDVYGGTSDMNGMVMKFKTSNTNYNAIDVNFSTVRNTNSSAGNALTLTACVLADMDASDTCQTSITVIGDSDTLDTQDNGYFTGFLVC